MTRDEAVYICQQRALAGGLRGDDPALPVTPAAAAAFQPPEWVVEAVLDASTGTGFYRQPGQA